MGESVSQRESFFALLNLYEVVGGMLKRHLAPETLERLLRNELLNDTKEETNKKPIPLVNLILSRGKKEGIEE